MQLVEKPLSDKRKIVAMYAGKFYMREAVRHEFILMLEHGLIVNERQAVDFIDLNGEWLE